MSDGLEPVCKKTKMSDGSVPIARENFPLLKNDNILRAAKGQPIDRIPVWAMRQAGRYLPEYMEFTKDKDFFSTCRNREWACKITLQPIERFDLDAAIIFSDILVIPQVLGMEVLMVPKEGPVFTSPLKSVSQWREIQCSLLQANGVSDSLADKDSALLDLCPQLVNTSLSYVYQAITLTRHRLEGRVPLIGFAGSPWTVFVYMTEGSASRLFSQCRK